ncbi:MAG: HAD family hydrolase [Thaumarchaeota archaeon]|jgi:HAD superfamily hydrolase (TIGR01549 family)|nr:HAD family hydrolase [Nitrososphaerota archaeon]
MSRNNNFYRGIIYDLDGTLNLSTSYYSVYDDYFTSLLSKFLDKSLEETEKIVNLSLHNKTGLTSLIQSLKIDSSLFYNELSNIIPISSLVHRDEKLISIIETINNMNVVQSVCSNTGYGLISKILESIGIRRYFREIISSDETGLKPSPEPYIYTLNKLKINAVNCIYVGDRIKMEINTAKTLGMTTVFVKSYLMEEKNINYSNADYSVESVYEMPILLNNLLGGI